MLLRFRVANHKSIRDSQELSLVAVPPRGAPKPRASEIPPTVQVAGIYGANASGKSNVLDALHWTTRAIANSHTGWSPDRGVPRIPFAFDPAARSLPTECELDFVVGGTRYSYGFEVDDEVVRREWLLSFPIGRPVRLFERTGPEEYTFGRALTGEKEQIRRLTRPNSLYLSSAASNNHELLGAIHRWITKHFMFARQDSYDELTRLGMTYQLLDDDVLRENIGRLMRLADLGIGEVAMSAKRPADDAFTRLIEALPRRRAEVVRDTTERTVELVHQADGGAEEGHRLSLYQESAGTQAWLTIVGPLMVGLYADRALVVDEIDSSLHPVLTSTLIRLFKDPKVNRFGTQLIFASHDTTLLGSMIADEILARDEVWFTEKDRSGATSLFSLAEFHPRKGENVERGYLQGRYGAVPYVRYDEVQDVFAGLWDLDDFQDAVR